MTRNLLFALLVAFSLPALAQDTTEARLTRLEDTLELTLIVNLRIAQELERLKTQDEKMKILLEGLIEHIIEIEKKTGLDSRRRQQ